MKLSVIAFRNIRRNKVRTGLTISAILFTTMIIVIMFAYIQGMKQDIRTTVVSFTTGDIRVRNPEYEKNAMLYPLDVTVDNYPELAVAIEKIPGVASAAPRINFSLEVGTEAEKTPQGLTIFSGTKRGLGFGLDFDREKNLSDLARYLQPGGGFPQPGEALVGSGFAKELGLATGDSMILFVQPRGYFSPRPVLARISGIVNLPLVQINNKAVFFAVDAAASMLAMETSSTEILVSVDKNADVATVAKSIANAFSANTSGGATMEIKPWNEIGFMYQWIDLAEKSFNFIALFFFLIGTTVIVVTTMMVIYERMKEIGTMSAMGMTGRQMVILFFLESFFISVIASAMGVAAGIGIVIPFSISGIDLNSLMDLAKTDMTISQIIFPQINVSSTIFVFFYSVVVASAASWFASRRAGKIEPIEALAAL